MNFQNPSFTTIDDPINNFTGLNKPDAVATDEEAAGVEYLKSLSPLEKLRLGYQILGVQIKDPKSDCQRCHGNGYVSINPDTGEPRACPCILPPEMHNGNRAERRAAARAARKLKF